MIAKKLSFKFLKVYSFFKILLIQKLIIFYYKIIDLNDKKYTVVVRVNLYIN